MHPDQHTMPCQFTQKSSKHQAESPKFNSWNSLSQLLTYVEVSSQWFSSVCRTAIDLHLARTASKFWTIVLYLIHALLSFLLSINVHFVMLHFIFWVICASLILFFKIQSRIWYSQVQCWRHRRLHQVVCKTACFMSDNWFSWFTLGRYVWKAVLLYLFLPMMAVLWFVFPVVLDIN